MDKQQIINFLSLAENAIANLLTKIWEYESDKGTKSFSQRKYVKDAKKVLIEIAALGDELLDSNTNINVADLVQAVGETKKVQEEVPVNFQKRVREWAIKAFGENITNDIVERNHRFLEESLELIQSNGCTKSEAHQLVDYVFNRPIELEIIKEVGGTLVTLSLLCSAIHLKLEVCGEQELRRIYEKIDTIKIKQANKPKHSPLPEINQEKVEKREQTEVFTSKLLKSITFKDKVIENQNKLIEELRDEINSLTSRLIFPKETIQNGSIWNRFIDKLKVKS